jgi:hypothetical protein
MAGFASLIPALLILFLFLFVMIIKFMTSTLRWLALHIISAATDPKTDPFTYAAALSVLLITLNRAIFEILSQ